VILVLGGKGVIGRRVVQLLRHGGREVLAGTREPIDPFDVYVDLTKPGSFSKALTGVDVVMLISRPGDEDAAAHAAPFVEAMEQSGVRRVVNLSAIATASRPEFSLRKVELLLESSSLDWTHVRPNFFMQMVGQPPLSTELRLKGTLSLPVGDARIAYVHAADVAAVLYRALVDDDLDGSAIDVSGPEAFNHAEMVDILSIQAGKRYTFRSVSDAEALRMMSERGMLAAQAVRVLDFYRFVRSGACSQRDEHVHSLIGRPLRSWQSYVQESLAAWL
jgi:uncharacterized protein YbjT (DUF2867 family)